MTVFSGMCSVTSCPFNLGNGRVACDWLRGGRGRCHHPAYREAWAPAHELAEAQELPVQPLSLITRATAANMPVSRERARQLILELEVAG